MISSSPELDQRLRAEGADGDDIRVIPRNGHCFGGCAIVSGGDHDDEP